MKRGVHALLLGLCLLLTQAALALADPLGDGLVAYATGDYATAWRVLRPWAEQGNPDALTAVGVMYVKGQGVDRDYTQALDLFNRAISAGSEDAEAELGYMYGSGYGVPQDYEEAISKYRDSIQKGSVRGENYLGEAYVAGQGVVKDYDQARQLFEDAARKGLPVALANLGNLYYLGRGVPKDLGTALRYYEAAAAKNSPEAQNNLGLMYQKGIGVSQDGVTAMRMFQSAALLGESAGAYNAGWALENGIGVPQDLLQAYAWYDIGAHEGGTFSRQRRDIVSTQLTAGQIQQATQAEASIISQRTSTAAQEATGTLEDGIAAYDQSDADTENDLGWRYQNGEGVPQDYAAAFGWYRKAADQGFAPAETNIGYMYEFGQGVAQDYAVALEWYRKASEQGERNAQLNIGWMYESGLGVTQDYSVAADWYRKAADQGLGLAQYALGAMYENGRGVSKDYAQAYQWYKLAVTDLPASDIANRNGAAKSRDRVAALAAAQASEASQQVTLPNSTSPQRTLKVVSSGSGFYVSNSALLPTNYHVVEGCTAISVAGAVASVTGADPQNDLALLSTSPRSGQVATLRVNPPVRAGERIVAVGFPLTGILAEQANVTTGDVSSLAGTRNDSRYLQITAPIQPGNSGGPLFDASGNVIGVVSAKLDAVEVAGVTGQIPENVNFALNVSVVRTFLDSRGVAYQMATSANELSAPDIGDGGKRITELVECWQ
jgi:TPR repeat protein